MEVANGDRDNFSIFGSDYNTSDGTCIRDYIHVLDLAIAHMKALDYLENNKINQIINLSTGVGSSVLDVVKQQKIVLTGRLIICLKVEELVILIH